jgi:tRNA pseudouridine38-40 synthase
MTLFDDTPEPPAPDEPMARVRLLVAYHGAGFHGFAAQAGVTTVGGTLAGTLARVLRVPDIELTCAGRTDAGVHAWGQVVTFDVPVKALDRRGSTSPRPGEPLEHLQQAVNKLCGPAIVVREAGIVDPSFDARFSATSRRYRYTIVNRPFPDPFLAPFSWHVAAPLDRRSLDQACIPFVGEHDFSSFCRRPKGGGNEGPITRRVLAADIESGGDGILHVWIEATAFCHQMVRSIVGTLVDVGRGRLRAGDVLGIIGAGDRHAAGDLAPPQGLCLWEVGYAGARSGVGGGAPGSRVAPDPGRSVSL